MLALKFTICEIPIEIRSISQILIDLFRDYFRYYNPQPELSKAIESNHRILLNLELAEELPSRRSLISPDARLYSQTGVIELWREEDDFIGERFLFDLGVAAFRVDPQAGFIEGWIAADALKYPHILANTYALFPLLLLLRSRGVYHLHAAAVVSPEDKLYLISGEQRAGKSTLTTALGLSGWKPISDDSLLIAFSEKKAKLTAFKKYFHISDELFDRWPKLREMTCPEKYLGRTCAEGLEFFHSRELADKIYNRVDYIIFPRITNRESSSVETISRGEAMLKLAEQSMFLQVWPERLKNQWEAVGEVARVAKALKLLSGTDYLEDRRIAASIIDSAKG